jgi:hypothetical protein
MYFLSSRLGVGLVRAKRGNTCPIWVSFNVGALKALSKELIWISNDVRRRCNQHAYVDLRHFRDMTEEQVATKAPESDAVQESPFPGDSVAQEGPSMGVSLGMPDIIERQG